MREKNWFDDRADGLAIATVMDDIAVTLDQSGLLVIDGPAGATTTIEFDDAVVLVVVLTEAIQILRERGSVERGDVLDWLRSHGADPR